ncbi:MAG: FecR domain-containing protein [Bdellovibrionales bacterium]|nr:FecR domain-containing protein [Bdellovibrionales bacterium]
MKRILKPVVFLYLLVFSAAGWSQEIGKVSYVNGEALHISAEKKQVTKGTAFSVGDVFELNKGSKVILRFDNGNRITLGSKTKFKIKAYPTEKKRTSPSLFDLFYGTIRAIVKGEKSKEASFRVLTPSSVTGVRGTDFLVSYDATLKEARCVTFEGLVEFSNLDLTGKRASTIQIAAGELSSVIEGQTPMKPKKLPGDRLKNLKRGNSFDARPKATRDQKPKASKTQRSQDAPQPTNGSNLMKKKMDQQSGRLRNVQEGARDDKKRRQQNTPPPQAPPQDKKKPKQ